MKISYKIIRWLRGDKYFEKQLAIFDQLDPRGFQVENVRALYNMSTSEAKMICDQAVARGTFDLQYGVTCPQCGRVIKKYDSVSEVDSLIEVHCEICEAEERDLSSFPASKIRKVELYSLHQ